MFGWTLIRKDRLKELETNYVQVQTLINVRRWFSGWRDLDIIWDYILGPECHQWGGISGARDRYAATRGTDEYGRVAKHEDKR